MPQSEIISPKSPAISDLPTVAVAFGGGGARGLSHIHIIETLDELGIRPVAISGSSIGAIMGTGMAAGMSGAEIREHALATVGNKAAVVSRIWGLRPTTVRDAVVSSAQAQADKLVAENTSGHPLHVELIQGPPASVVTHAAEQGGHDLIAIGTHGHRGFRRLLLGSVAESVIRHAPCSVLVAHGEHAGETSKLKKA